MHCKHLAMLLTSALMLALAAAPCNAAATQAAQQKQDLSALRQKAEAFLTAQSQGYPGQVKISVGAIDQNLRLAQCPAPDVFMPAGSRAWGKTSVGVRCAAPVAWTIYIQANVSVMGQYLIAAAPLAQGHVIGSDDVVPAIGDLTKLPPGIFTDAAQALGRSVSMSLMAGAVLRQEILKAPLAIQRGQAVQITSIGKGFRISAEGKAMGSAGDGDIVQVKVASGELISGVARAGGKVEVTF